jgi:hypothetical protein
VAEAGVITHLLNRTALWQRNRPVSVGPGKFADALVTINPALACRVQIGGFGEASLAADWRTVATHTFYTDPGVGLVRDDLLTTDDDGVQYKILAKLPPSKPQHHLKWAAREQQQEPARP